LPDVSRRLHWPFENPKTFEGTEEKILEKFREVRDQIDQRIRSWLAEQGITVRE
jgi:arsenate reductase